MDLEPYSDEWIDYILRLEKERYGPSVTDVPSKQELDDVKVAKIRLHFAQELAQLEALAEQRDKIMFNAGRFAAGDRDSVAVASNSLLNALLESELN